MTAQNFARPQGIIVFKNLEDALRNGFHVYDKTGDGYLVRTQTAAGWALALVRLERS